LGAGDDGFPMIPPSFPALLISGWSYGAQGEPATADASRRALGASCGETLQPFGSITDFSALWHMKS
jgi:hypothetical protein